MRRRLQCHKEVDLQAHHFFTIDKETIDRSVELIKRSDHQDFVVLPKCWIVQRTFSWLENHHRISVNCERTLENSRQGCLLAGIAILLKGV
ncbi:transposase [Bacillus thuringiensis]|uniref:transposase n=1 Tax=Bacillus thuringiensis TaxID=1428 RepID=UPI0018CCF04E|nr:transposase [Bacillus thuringiensis]